MTDRGQGFIRASGMLPSLISIATIVLTAIVAGVFFRAEVVEGFRTVANILRPDAAVFLLALSSVLLIISYIKQRQSNRKIVREVENRDKEILFHRGRNKEIRESEQRYKTLFEDAMHAAYLDLEKLNANLKEKQGNLADEIEKHKETEAALKESELRWMKLVEKNPDAIVITVGETIAYVNPSGLSILGGETLDRVRGVPLSKFLPENLREEVSNQLAAQSIGSESQPPLEFEIEGIDGVVRNVELHAVPAVFRGQQAAQSVLRDVTERKKSEQSLRRYTERLRTMVELERMTLLSEPVEAIAGETLTRLVDLVDFDIALVVEFNQLTGHVGQLATLGIDNPDEALANSPFKRRQWNWPDPVCSDHIDIVVGDPQLDAWIRTLDIKSYTCVPLAARDEILGVMIFGAYKPVSFKGEVVETISEFADLLALGINQHRIVEERKNYETEILSAKEHAEELVRLKSAFLTNMSHEIRTPLTSIIGFAQILGEEIEGSQSEFLELIEQSGKRLLETINSVLDLARLESNNVQVEPESLDIATMINDSVALLQPLAIRRGIGLSTEGTETPLLGEIDKAGLDRILNNLVGNAIKFTDRGGVVVRLSSTLTTMRIEVEDTGIGISDQFIPFIFDDFKQESNGPSRSYEGSGMGLSITRKLIEVMNGTIEVSSRKGEGSIFTVTLPLVSESRDSAPSGLTSFRDDTNSRDLPARKLSRNVPGTTPFSRPEAIPPTR